MLKLKVGTIVQNKIWNNQINWFIVYTLDNQQL